MSAPSPGNVGKAPAQVQIPGFEAAWGQGTAATPFEDLGTAPSMPLSTPDSPAWERSGGDNPPGPGMPIGKNLPPARGLPSSRKGLMGAVSMGVPAPQPGIASPVGAPAEEEEGPRIRVRKRRRKKDEAVEQGRSGVWLSWAFGIVGMVFLLLYVFETYRTLTGSPPLLEVAPEGERTGAGSAGDGALPPLAVDLTDQMDCVSQFLGSPTHEGRLPFVLEGAADEILRRMEVHYAAFPLGGGQASRVSNSGTHADTGRDYVSGDVEWRAGGVSKVRLVRDAVGDYRFSWTAFEQAQCQLLREYTETAWSEWTWFYMELKPLDPRRLPEGIILENLYYRVTVPEDPEFEAIAYVDEHSTLVPQFAQRFTSERTYEVVVELQRDSKLLDDDRPVFRLTGLLAESLDFPR